MEQVILAIVVITAIISCVYAIQCKQKCATVEAMRLQTEGDYKAQIAQLRKEAEMTAANVDSARAESERRVAEAKADAERNLAVSKQEMGTIITETKAERDVLKQEKEKVQEENSQLRAALETTQKLLETSKAQAEKDEKSREEKFHTELNLAREQMRAQFEKEMKERSDTLKQEAQERMDSLRRANSEQMETIVGPLKKELEQLRQLVDKSHEVQTRNTSSLEASIKAVFEHDKERDKTTQNLAEALKNRGKVQGDWGEMVLENILRDSGLREGEEYVKQQNVKTEDGANERPDIIVNGADGSRVIIDSKVSLTAYTDYVGAETEEERTTAVKANYDSIWKHVCELADMKYHKDVEKAMPIVLMFIPNEGSYILAMNKDPQLGTKAYKKGVLIINPTNLMVVLRLMFLTWQNTRQEKNNREILAAAGKIYEKYTTFADSYVTLGNQLSTARNTYDKGMGQLREGRGNLSKQLQDLLKYGVTPSKQIPEEMKSLELGE